MFKCAINVIIFDIRCTNKHLVNLTNNDFFHSHRGNFFCHEISTSLCVSANMVTSCMQLLKYSPNYFFWSESSSPLSVSINNIQYKLCNANELNCHQTA